MSDTKFAPSYHFLYTETAANSPPYLNISNSRQSSTRTDRGIAFVGADTGFLPPAPLAKLPMPYDGWENAAASLPDTCKADSWFKFSNDFPDISSDDLPDEHIPLACLGAVAHALANIGHVPVPKKVMTPGSISLTDWEPRLLAWRTTIWLFAILGCCLTAWIRNLSKHPHVAQCQAQRLGSLIQEYRRSPPLLSLGQPETIFWTGTFAVEHSARHLPGITARAQQAVVSCDTRSLRQAIVEIIEVL